MFGETPPPLLPILEVANFWSDKGYGRITAATKKFKRQYTQIRWRFCAVTLGPEFSLPLVGFWMMNVCPSVTGETTEHREWTVVFLVDANTGRSSVTTDYRAKIWLSNKMRGRALAETTDPLALGETGIAVVHFLESRSRNFPQLRKTQRLDTPYAGGNYAVIR